MNSSHDQAAVRSAGVILAAPSARRPLAAHTVLAMLQRLRRGRLELHLPDGQVLPCPSHATAAPSVVVRVHDWKVFSLALRRGDIGFAQAYCDGRWTTPDLPALLKLLLANRQAVEGALHGSFLGTMLDRLRHLLLRRNTRAGSRDNIHAHYDLGNAFYSLWLDRGMTYSSALFTRSDMSLEQAQQAKLQRVLDALRVQAGQRVLEIGCGWGSFAELAATRGVQVDGVTLSRQQHAFATQRLQQAGLAERARTHLLDYRDAASIAPQAGFDAVASIEMFEAVGEAYWARYFHSVASLLKPGGRACIQTITIDEALFERYRRGTDFIQRYIFPGGMLPSPSRFVEGARAAGLQVLDTHRFGADYARTLALWRQRFLDSRAMLPGLGFDRRFERLWEFYLAYCEAGFTEGTIDVVQYTLVKTQQP